MSLSVAEKNGLDLPSGSLHASRKMWLAAELQDKRLFGSRPARILVRVEHAAELRGSSREWRSGF
jgi:hypothetical protein